MDLSQICGRRMSSSSVVWLGPKGGLLLTGGVRGGVGLRHACLTACLLTALAPSLCSLFLPCASSGLLALPIAVCTACSCQHCY